MYIEQREIDKLLEDHRAMHSEFQIANFIVGGGGNHYGQYMQALREIKTRNDRLFALRHDLEIKKMDRDETTESGSPGHQRRSELHRLALDRAIDELERTIAEIERELSAFVALARERLAIIGPLTPERIERLERENWLFKTKRLAAIDLISSGTLTHSTAELISLLPGDCRREITQALQNRPALIGWFEGENA